MDTSTQNQPNRQGDHPEDGSVTTQLASWLDYQVAWLGGRLAEAREFEIDEDAATALAAWLEQTHRWVKEDVEEAIASQAEMVELGHADPNEFVSVLMHEKRALALVDGLGRLAAWLRGPQP